MLKYIVFNVLFAWTVFTLNAQDKKTITVTDSSTGDPVEYAHVQLKPLPKGKTLFNITDRNGKVVFNTTGKFVLSVSFLGYQTFIDTISGKSDLSVKLRQGSVTIDDVVITGHAVPVKTDKSIYNVKVLSMKKEEGKVPIDLYQVLSTESNIRIQQDRFVGGKMKMKGLTGEYVKILVDGVPVAGRLDGNIDITQINMNNVDHIEIVEGPLSVIYGSGALAGTINIITKEKRDDGMNLSVSTYGESVGLANGDFMLMLKKKRHGFGISGMGYYFNGWDDSDTLYRAQSWKPKTKYSASGYYRYTIKNLILNATSNIFHENIIDKGEPFGDRNQNAFDHNYITQRMDFKADGSHFVKNRYNVNVFVAYNYYQRQNKTTFLNFDDNTSKETKSVSSRFDQISSRMIYSAGHSTKFKWQAGYDILWQKYSGDRVLLGARDMGDYAAFATLNYSPVNKLSLQPGFRVMYNTKYTAPLVYSVNLLYSPVKSWQNRFSFSRGFKSPDLKQLYLDFHLSNLSITGNPDLNTEDSYNIDINSTVKISKFKFLYTISAKTFYNRINNKIELVSVNNNEMKYTYININEIKTAGYGMDISFTNHPAYSFTFSWTTTGLWNSFGGKYDAPEQYTWYTDVGSTINYRFEKSGINLSLNYKFNGKSPQYILEDQTIGLFQRDKYNMMEFSASKSMMKKRLSVMAGVKNIFNVTDVKQTLDGTDYVSLRGSDIIAYGRSWFMKITYAL